MPSLDDLKKNKKCSLLKRLLKPENGSSNKIKKAQESAEKGRPYSQKLQNIILNLTKSISDPQNAPKLLVGTGEDKKYLCGINCRQRFMWRI